MRNIVSPLAGLQSPFVLAAQFGPDLVTNGDFAAGTDWTLGPGWSIGSGVASCDGSQVAQSFIRQNLPIAIKATYRLTFDLVATIGNINQLRLGGVNDNVVLTTGSHTHDMTTTDSTNDLQIRCNSTFVGTVDNVIVRRINP